MVEYIRHLEIKQHEFLELCDITPFNPKLLPFKTTRSDYYIVQCKKKISSCAIVTNVFKTVLILGLNEKNP